MGSITLLDSKKLDELRSNLEKLAFLFKDNQNEYDDLLETYDEIADTARESIGWAALNRTKIILERAQGTATIVDPEGKSLRALLSAINTVNTLLNNDGLQYNEQKPYDMFLSYSTANEVQATTIYDFLIGQNYKVFMAKKEISPGDIWEEMIKSALKNSRLFCIIASQESLSSEWVKTEVNSAWLLDKPRLPILYRCAPEDLPDKLQKYQAIDYHEYKELVDVLETLPK